MKFRHLLLGVCMLVAIAASFIAGIEIGHRVGYDHGFMDCRYDAKETLWQDASPAFWRWHGGAPMAIRKHRSFLF